MKIPAGVASSAMVLTPTGPVRADSVRRGDALVSLSGGRLGVSRVRSVDRSLCCSMVRVASADGAELCMGEMTELAGEGGCLTLRPGGEPAESDIASETDLNFCQHVLHWHCGEGVSIFAGGGSGAYIAVDASFIERQE